MIKWKFLRMKIKIIKMNILEPLRRQWCFGKKSRQSTSKREKLSVEIRRVFNSIEHFFEPNWGAKRPSLSKIMGKRVFFIHHALFKPIFIQKKCLDISLQIHKREFPIEIIHQAAVSALARLCYDCLMVPFCRNVIAVESCRN